jgi:MFS family permease
LFVYTLTNVFGLKVGFVEALQGISSLATALPAGWAADRWPRSRVIAFGGFTSLAAAPLFGFAVFEAASAAKHGESSHRAYIMLCVAFALFGFGSGIGSGPAQALMADSIPTGQRSKYYNWLFQVKYLSDAPPSPLHMFNYSFKCQRRRM